MKKYLAFFDGLSKLCKILFALPFVDIAWAIYRLFRTVTKNNKDVLAIVTASLLIVVGIPFLWIVDIVCLDMDKPVPWFD